jgi:hypothetical protein
LKLNVEVTTTSILSPNKVSKDFNGDEKQFLTLRLTKLPENDTKETIKEDKKLTPKQLGLQSEKEVAEWVLSGFENHKVESDVKVNLFVGLIS